jgi:hypothetical protein
MKSHWLYPPINEGLLNFLVISMSFAAAIEIFGGRVFPGFGFFGWVLSTLVFFTQNLNLVLIQKDFLHVISVQVGVGSIKWGLDELDVSGARELDVSVPRNDWEIPQHLSTQQRYGSIKLENGKSAFHFISRSKVPLVLIPVKKGGYILLSLKAPKNFLTALCGALR